MHPTKTITTYAIMRLYRLSAQNDRQKNTLDAFQTWQGGERLGLTKTPVKAVF